jgi:hypothetical protein
MESLPGLKPFFGFTEGVADRRGKSSLFVIPAGIRLVS